jgi:hypothetical protein
MPDKDEQGSRRRGQGGGPGPRKAGLVQMLKEAHEADHEILDDLGIKHPHVPILDIVEMLDHLRKKHVD